MWEKYRSDGRKQGTTLYTTGRDLQRMIREKRNLRCYQYAIWNGTGMGRGDKAGMELEGIFLVQTLQLHTNKTSHE